MNDIVAKLAESSAQVMQAGGPYELEEKSIGGVQYRLYKQAPATMKELLGVGRAHGNKTFLVYEGERWSFTDFFQQVDAIAHQLMARYDVTKGDRIAISMRNYPEWMATYTAAVSIGAIAVPLNSWGQRKELIYGLTDAGAKVVFCDQQRYDYISDDLDSLDIRAVLVRGDSEPAAKRAESLAQFLQEGLGKAMPEVACDTDEPIMIMYTSGTTGNPKGALSSHRNIIQAVINFEFHGTSSAMANPEAMEKMFGGGFEAAGLLAVPLFHVSGCHAMFMLSLRGGRKIVMMYKWNPGEALKLVEKERITIISGVPSMLIDLLEHPDFDKTDTDSLFSIGGGGTATPPRFNKLVHDKVDRPYTGAGFGLTETNATCSNCTGKAYLYKPSSAGIISPIVDVKTCDEEGNDLPRGETGEIWIKSPTVVKEYWNKPEANAKSFRDGWFASGDIGYVDEENFVFLVDRAKDMVIRAGENIASAEIEACISDHPAIHEVAAFGVPHEVLGEELAVAITCKPGQQTTEQDIQQFVRERLAGFKVPSYVWIRETAMPRNATGKLLKKMIREEYLNRGA